MVLFDVYAGNLPNLDGLLAPAGWLCRTAWSSRQTPTTSAPTPLYLWPDIKTHDITTPLSIAGIRSASTSPEASKYSTSAGIRLRSTLC